MRMTKYGRPMKKPRCKCCQKSASVSLPELFRLLPFKLGTPALPKAGLGPELKGQKQKEGLGQGWSQELAALPKAGLGQELKGQEQKEDLCQSVLGPSCHVRRESAAAAAGESFLRLASR